MDIERFCQAFFRAESVKVSDDGKEVVLTWKARGRAFKEFPQVVLKSGYPDENIKGLDETLQSVRYFESHGIEDFQDFQRE